uniref:Uncharacterized protein n=1 Tax=Arundo donax TaxID=35708 RepID=A0A0A8ZLL3_ARUDO
MEGKFLSPVDNECLLASFVTDCALPRFGRFPARRTLPSHQSWIKLLVLRSSIILSSRPLFPLHSFMSFSDVPAVASSGVPFGNSGNVLLAWHVKRVVSFNCIKSL